jgi:hypothetical protein
MRDEKIEKIRGHIRWAFMAVVTATMLALTFEQARRGLPGMATASVYALTVGFGLEFLRAEWSGGRRGTLRADAP